MDDLVERFGVHLRHRYLAARRAPEVVHDPESERLSHAATLVGRPLMRPCRQLVEQIADECHH